MTELAPESIISHYRIVCEIGKGGMGEVYLARDRTELDRQLAIKILPSQFISDKQRVLRFVNEAKTVSNLNHPNILTIYELGVAGSARFIASEYVEGVTLRERLRHGPMSLHEVLDTAIQIVSALDAAHDAGVIHRDIKPENVMIRNRDHLVKVLDFGLAKLVQPHTAKRTSDPDAPTLVKTEAGTLMGTVSYMSPEQATASATVDQRSDIWSAGVVMYEMIAGRVPFGGPTVYQQLAAIEEEDPPPLSKFVLGVPERLEEIVDKAVAKTPDERYQTAKDLLIDLRHLRKKMEVEAEIERVASDPHATAVPHAARTSSAEYLVSEIKQHRTGFLLSLVLIAILLAAGLAYHFYAASRIDSIAVLPFANVTDDPSADYLSDGIPEALINSLTQLQELKVIARATAFRYKGREVDPRAIGKELGVKAILMGKVRQTGDNIDVQLDLVNAVDGAQLWGKEYQGKTIEMLKIKQNIVYEITEALRLRLSNEKHEQLVSRDTGNSIAYQSYIRGRYWWNKRTAESLNKAVEQFQKAIDLDPNYALAYVGLADCYLMMEEYSGTPSSETLPKSRIALEQALKLNPQLPEAHASLGLALDSGWEWDAAEKQYQQAIALNPKYAASHHWYAIHLYAMRRFGEALSQIKEALELDPLSGIIGQELATAYTLTGDAKSAIDQAKRTIELDPNFPIAYEALGIACFKSHDYPAAIDAFQKEVEMSGRSSSSLASLGFMYGLNGSRAQAIAILNELKQMYKERRCPEMYVAMVYIGLSDKDETFAWLQKGVNAHGALLSYMTWDPRADSIRDDPRYESFLKSIKLK